MSVLLLLCVLAIPVFSSAMPAAAEAPVDCTTDRPLTTTGQDSWYQSVAVATRCDPRPVANCWLDQFGYCMRNCTSYTAQWLISRGADPKEIIGLGHGGWWFDGAKARGIPVGDRPRLGAAAVKPATPGHVGIVTKLYDNDGNGVVEAIDVESYDGFTQQKQFETKVNTFTHFIYFSRRGPSGLIYPTYSDMPVTGDWNGDRKTDTAVVQEGEYLQRQPDGNQTRMSTGQFHLRQPDGAVQMKTYGLGSQMGDLPLVGNWDGVGGDDPGIVRGRQFFRSTVSGPPIAFGTGIRNGDIPISGDWDGDKRTDIGIVREVVRNGIPMNEWHLRHSSAYTEVITFGAGITRPEHDIPITGDWDGDGRYEPGIVRGNQFIAYRRSAPNGPWSWTYGAGINGAENDVPITGNWDAVGGTDAGVVRRQTWWRQHQADPISPFGRGVYARLP